MSLQLSVVDVLKKYAYDRDETVSASRSYISWGSDNRFPSFCKNLIENSATMNTIINAYKNYILGEGIELNQDLAQFANEINKRGDTIEDFVGQIAYDYLLHGNFAIQFIYSKTGNITEFYALDVTKCRTNENHTKVFYNKKGWASYSSKYETFDSWKKGVIPDNYTSILFYTGGSRSIYGKPMYEGAIKDILTEIETTSYSLNSVANGFSARYVISIPQASNLPQEQKDKLKAEIKNQFTGSETSSNFMLYFANGNLQNAGLKIDKIQGDDTPEQFVNIKKSARDNIFTAFAITPNLVGTPDQTTGFNSQEYSSAFKLFNKTQISPIQKVIVRIFDKVFDTKNGITIKPFHIEFDAAE